jgi:hypothetical protein
MADDEPAAALGKLCSSGESFESAIAVLQQQQKKAQAPRDVLVPATNSHRWSPIDYHVMGRRAWW